jgi:hypothetical protein
VPTKVPPVAASYQLRVYPAAGPFVTVKAGIVDPIQYEALAATGAVIDGQVQFGAVTESVPGHPDAVDVNVLLVVAIGIKLIVQIFPDVFTTVPAELVNVPAETVTPTDHVNKSAEHNGAAAIVIVGVGNWEAMLNEAVGADVQDPLPAVIV